MTALGLFRRVRLPTLVRAITRSRFDQGAQYAGAAIAALVAFIGVLVASFAGFRAVLSFPEGAALASAALAGIFNTTVVSEIFVGVTAAVHTLYLSRDLAVLRGMPIRERTLFAYKFWETLAGNAALFLVLGLPVALAYGLASGAGVGYYPAVMLVSVLVLMIPTALAILLVMPLMRLVPASRAAEIVAVLWSLSGLVVWLGFQLLLREGAEESTKSELGPLLRSPLLSVPPGSWGAGAALGVATGDLTRAVSGLLPLSALALGLYACCLAVAVRAYAVGWARAGESGQRVRRGRPIARLLGWLPPDVRAVTVKDLTTLPRDLRQLATVGALSVMGVVFATLPGGPFAMDELGGPLAGVLPYIVAVGLAALAGTGWATQAIGGEGRAFWLLAVAPLAPSRLLLAKWLAATLVGAATVTVTLAVLAVLRRDGAGVALGLPAGLLLTAVLSACCVGASAAFARFDWDNPRQATTTAGGCVLSLAFLGLFGLGALAVAAGVALLATGLPAPVALLVGGAIWLVPAGVLGGGLLWLGYARLRAMEWEL